MVERYNNIHRNLRANILPRISTYLPQPNELDYRRGYITRYFIQRAINQPSPIFEINKQQFSIFKSNNLYNIVQLEWRISGSNSDISLSNRKSILGVANRMPMLVNYLQNHYQFART